MKTIIVLITITAASYGQQNIQPTLNCTGKCFDFDYFFLVYSDTPPVGYEFDISLPDFNTGGWWYFKHYYDNDRLCICNPQHPPDGILVVNGATTDPSGTAYYKKYWPMKICIQNEEWYHAKTTNDSAAGNPCSETLNTNDFRTCLVDGAYLWESSCESLPVSPMIAQWNFVNECDSSTGSVRLMPRYDPTIWYDPGGMKLAIVVSILNITYESNGDAVAERYIRKELPPPGMNPNRYSSYPAFEFNVSSDFYQSGRIWTTACPCNSSCTGKRCVNICKVLTHEIGHLYELNDSRPGCPVTRSAADLMEGSYNDPPCTTTLSETDRCNFCMKHCPGNCADIVGIDIAAQETPSSFSVTCYPNPANSTVTIDINPSLNTVVNGSVYDMQGKLVYQFNTRNAVELSGRFVINFKSLGLCKGTYFLVVDNEKEVASTQLVLR